MIRSALVIWILFAAFLIAAVFVRPASVAFAESAAADWSSAALGPRRLGLLSRGIWVAGVAATLAVLLGGGLACGVARGGWVRGLLLWGAVTVLLTPPYLYAYAWSLPLLPQGISVAATQSTPWPAWLTHEGRAIWCLACWTAPVAAFICVRGWRGSGQEAYGLATLDAGPLTALTRAALPAMRAWIAAGLLATGLLALTEYSVCHLCQVQTWNTEVLAEIQTSSQTGQALLLAWPLLALIAVIGAVLLLLRSRLERNGLFGSDAGLEGLRPATWAHVAPVAVATLGVLLLPMVIFAIWFGDWTAIARPQVAFKKEWGGAIISALISGGMALVIAAGLDALYTIRPFVRIRALRTFLTWLVFSAAALAVISAAAPPALVGDAVKAAYEPVEALSRSPLPLSIATCARFAAVAIIAQLVAGRAVDRGLRDAAAVDGAGAAAYLLRVHAPLTLTAGVAAALVAALLAFTEVGASVLVRYPGVASISITMLNEIHFGRNAETIAVALYISGGVGLFVAAGLGAGWLRRRLWRPGP